MQDGKNKNSGFSSTRDCLANYILTVNGIWNTFLLYFRGLLESAFCNGSVQLFLQKEVFEACAVHSSIVGYPTFKSRCLNNGYLIYLLLLVVNGCARGVRLDVFHVLVEYFVVFNRIQFVI